VRIPVFKPSIAEEEIEAVVAVLRSGWLGLGPKTEEFERAFAGACGARHCVALNSCTAALHLALATLRLQPGEEVVVTPMTFVATVHAIVYCGATPVFADIQPDTLNLDPAAAARWIGPRTRAILAVDMAGHPCDLDELQSLAASHGLTLVEDAAHACGAFYRGRPIGAIAPLTCFSFHAVKNLTCGEGGAVTCADDRLDRWFREMRWLGISKGTWVRTAGGAAYNWRYAVEEVGYKYHLNDMAAALGLVQLGRLPALNAARRRIAARYTEALAGLDWLATPRPRPYVGPSCHLYQVRLPDETRRDRFLGHLAARGIGAGVHYIPSHLHPCYRHLKADCPVASEVWRTLVSLPIFPDLTGAEQDHVIAVARGFQP